MIFVPDVRMQTVWGVLAFASILCVILVVYIVRLSREPVPEWLVQPYG